MKLPRCAGPAVLLPRAAGVAALLALDLWSKAAVFAWLGRLGRAGELVPHHCGLGDHLRRPLLGEWLAFSLSRNPGAAFGRLAGAPHVLVAGRILAVLVLGWLLLRDKPAGRGVAASLVLILAGALGNLYDNLFLAEPGAAHPFGLVRDFIDVYFRALDWHFDTFNVADACICVGAAILLLQGLFARRAKAPPEGYS
jgi:signal peptidase II